MKKLFLILPFIIFSCSMEYDYIEVANNQSKPLLVFDRIFDCRSQSRTLWATKHSQVIAHIINLSRGSQILHKGSYRDTIYESAWDYRLSTIENDDHYFEVFYYDVELIDETESFIRFITIDKEGRESAYIINKETLILNNTGIEKKVMDEDKILDGFKKQFINLNTIERPCKII